MNDWHLIGHCFHSLHFVTALEENKKECFKKHYVNSILYMNYCNSIEKLLLKGGMLAMLYSGVTA